MTIRIIAGAFLGLVLSTAATFATERKLDGTEIAATLADQVLSGTADTSQIFQKSGVTFYAQGGNQSQGLWKVVGDQYCSQWPPNESWPCYDVIEDGDTITLGISASDTTITVAANTGFPTTAVPFAPFVIQMGTEQLRVTAVNGNDWTVVRGINGSTAAPQGNATTITLLTNQLFNLSRPNFNNAADQITTLKFLTSIQADWRFLVPDVATVSPATTALTAAITNPAATTLTVASNAGFPLASAAVPFVVTIDNEQIRVINSAGNTWTVVRGVNGTTATAHLNAAAVSQIPGNHPVLYVAGEGGVFRSINKGVTWTYYPNVADDGAAQEGGYLPNANVTSLDLVLGNVNPTTGFHDPSSGLNMLLATTYGRGDFAIRLDNSSFNQYIVAPNSGPRITNVSPIVITNGSQLNGYDITFAGGIDPTSFALTDITVTRPGNVSVGLASLTFVSGNTYRILFSSPQNTVGNYVLNIGPGVFDYSGNAMNQDNDTVNGENPADILSNTFFFTPNNPPTMTVIFGTVHSAYRPTADSGRTTGFLAFFGCSCATLRRAKLNRAANGIRHENTNQSRDGLGKSVGGGSGRHSHGFSAIGHCVDGKYGHVGGQHQLVDRAPQKTRSPRSWV